MRLTNILLFTIAILFFIRVQIAEAQGKGCPANPEPASTHQYQIISTIPLLAEPIPETASSELIKVVETRRPTNKFPGFSSKLASQPVATDFSIRVPLNDTAKGAWRVILSSTPDGQGSTCTDDKVKIETSTGMVFEHDFRSPDRSRIVPLEPVDVTALFETSGEMWVQLYLIDITGPRFSSSPYYLVVIEATPGGPLPPLAQVYSQLPPRVAATFTSTSQPTASPTRPLTPTRTPTLTPTPTTVLPVSALPAEIPSRPIPLSPRLIGGLALLLTAMILVWFSVRRPKLSGVLEITKAGESWKTVDLSTYGRTVTLGSGGRIRLEDDDEAQPNIPPIAARLAAERGPDGNVHVLWHWLADEAEGEAASYRLEHGEVEVIGPYRLAYQNFSETNIEDELLAGGVWNDV